MSCMKATLTVWLPVVAVMAVMAALVGVGLLIGDRLGDGCPNGYHEDVIGSSITTGDVYGCVED